MKKDRTFLYGLAATLEDQFSPRPIPIFVPGEMTSVEYTQKSPAAQPYWVEEERLPALAGDANVSPVREMAATAAGMNLLSMSSPR
ncbi:hypothetical protein ACNF49_32810 [Actinomadura sp. ATCC 39365]